MIFEPQVINVTVDEEEPVLISADVTVTHAQADYYEGEYSVIPQREEVTLSTKDKLLTDNVVVAPIPNNYGLITWDGSVLTVS